MSSILSKNVFVLNICAYYLEANVVQMLFEGSKCRLLLKKNRSKLKLA